MSHPLGDPASLSSLAAQLRGCALLLRADAERVGLSLEDATPGWSGPSALAARRRSATVVASLSTVAESLEESARSLQRSATDLAETIARLRSVEQEAQVHGFEVRDGIVQRVWGITGVADADAEAGGEITRATLQERVHHLAAAAGRHRAALRSDAQRSARTLTEVSAALRA